MASPVNVFGSKPAALTPFVDSGTDGDELHLIEHAGKAAIFKVQGPEEVTTKFGLRTAVKADVIVFGPDGEPTRFSDVLIFNQVPVGQLKPLAGQTTVAMIETYEKKTGGDAPKLAEPTPEVVALAEKILAG